MKTKVSKNLSIAEKYSIDQINEQRSMKIMSALKEAAELGDDNQENHTPLEICEMMLSKVDLNKAKSILVLYNVEIIFSLKKSKYEGRVVFLTSSLKKAELVQKMNYNVEIEYITKDENPLYHLEMNFPEKFDIVLSNPPYGTRTNKMDLKFIEKCLNISKGEMVFVHPASSYIDLKGKNQTYNSYLEKSERFIDEVTIFNGNFIFEIDLFVPCAITKFNKNKKEGKIKVINRICDREDFIDSFDQISIWGSRKEFFSIKEKILEKIEEGGSLHSEGNVLGSRATPIINNPESYFVEFTPIRGHINGRKVESSSIYQDDFFTLIKSESSVKRGVPVKYLIWFEFETEVQAKNFLSYIKTDFARAALSLSKTNATLFNGELKSVPWVDFNQEWTNEKLYAQFNISKEEQEFIKEIIPPYYV